MLRSPCLAATERINKHFPLPRSNRGYLLSEFIKALLNEAMVILPSIEKVQNILGVLDILIEINYLTEVSPLFSLP